jgi:glycosyltransferase involved in cell wall biosynthesis
LSSKGALRVAIDATPLIGRPTGVGVFCSGLLTALAERPELSVSAFAVSWRRRQAIEPLLPGAVVVHQRAMPARPLHALWRHADVPPVEWFIGRTDVIHGTNFVVPPSRRARRLVTVHDLTPLRFAKFADPATLIFPDLIRRALRSGAWVHTPSDFVASEVIEAFNANPERVRAVHSGTPELSECQDPLAARRLITSADWWPEGCERSVLSLGTAEPRKDLPGLVRAFDKVAEDHGDLALVLVGPDGWGTDALEEAIAASPFRSRIARTGWLEESTLAAAIVAASVLAYPSIYEGFGFPPLQAMAAGTPVVATRAGALPEILGDAAELVEVNDSVGLAEAMARILDHPEIATVLVEKGRQRAAEFSWSRCAQEMSSLYRDLSTEGAGR